jgi:alanine racemase
MERVTAEINLGSLRQNLHIIRRKAPGTRILAMVKGNAYGHGMATIVKALMDVDYLGVACLEAALALRHAGVIQPIVLTTGFFTEEDLALILEHHIQPFIFNQTQIDLIKAFYKNLSLQDKKDKKDKKKSLKNNSSEKARGLEVWLQVDTGMHCLGFPPKASLQAWQQLYLMQTTGGIQSIKWATHFACSDEEDSPQTLEQIDLFSVLTQEMGELKSAANSAAILQYPEAHFDIIRPGIMLYGISPIRMGCTGYEKLFPVMTLKARVIALNLVERGESVGVGAEWTAYKATRIAVVSIGYGDGYPELAPEGTPVLIRGKIAPIIGRVAMDSLTIDVSKFPDVNLHDEVILWGEDLPIECVAAEMGFSPYGLLTSINQRVCRQVVELEE